MNIFWGVLKTKSLLFERSADGSTKFGSLFVEKIKNKVYFLRNHLLLLKILPVTIFRNLVTAF